VEAGGSGAGVAKEEEWRRKGIGGRRKLEEEERGRGDNVGPPLPVTSS
jgi:hypothetical protein